MQYLTMDDGKKREILQERLGEIELRHFETELNLMGCEIAPVKNEKVLADINALKNDLRNIEALIQFTKEKLEHLPLVAADEG